MVQGMAHMGGGKSGAGYAEPTHARRCMGLHPRGIQRLDLNGVPLYDRPRVPVTPEIAYGEMDANAAPPPEGSGSYEIQWRPDDLSPCGFQRADGLP